MQDVFTTQCNFFIATRLARDFPDAMCYKFIAYAREQQIWTHPEF